MKTCLRVLWMGAVMLPVTGAAWESDSEVLLRSYIRFSLAREVHAQTLALTEELSQTDSEQVQSVADEWFGDELDTLRRELDRQFGDAARTRFAAFVDEYTAAEDGGDMVYLDRLSSHVNLREPPADYAALRRLALERWLEVPMSEGIRLLSEIQTWADVRARDPGAPPLDYWLEREGGAEPVDVPPRPPVNPLAEAEAPAPAWNESVRGSDSALDAFAGRRRERREQALQSAQAGMQQMALERQSAEQEYAARVMADAQADAEAMRAQAQKLAAAEAEAMAQRENSWGNRIKRIVGGTVSAGLGAFTGGIGSEAGRRAADEVFR